MKARYKAQQLINKSKRRAKHAVTGFMIIAHAQTMNQSVEDALAHYKSGYVDLNDSYFKIVSKGSCFDVVNLSEPDLLRWWTAMYVDLADGLNPLPGVDDWEQRLFEVFCIAYLMQRIDNKISFLEAAKKE